MDQEKVGKFIKQIRESKKLTQDELGEKLGISGKSVSKWERGLTMPDISNLPLVADLLGVTINELLSGEKNPNKDVSNDNYVKGIKFYNKKLKYKYLHFLFFIILLFVGTLALLYVYNDYDKNRVYQIMSNDKNYDIKGYFIVNQGMNILMIEDIMYQGDMKGTAEEPILNEAYISLMLKNNILAKYNEKLSSFIPYSEYIDLVSFTKIDNHRYNKKIIIDENKEDFYLSIESKTKKDNVSMKIPLKLKRIFSNDKIFY